MKALHDLRMPWIEDSCSTVVRAAARLRAEQSQPPPGVAVLPLRALNLHRFHLGADESGAYFEADDQELDSLLAELSEKMPALKPPYLWLAGSLNDFKRIVAVVRTSTWHLRYAGTYLAATALRVPPANSLVLSRRQPDSSTVALVMPKGIVELAGPPLGITGAAHVKECAGVDKISVYGRLLLFADADPPAQLEVGDHSAVSWYTLQTNGNWRRAAFLARP